MNRRKLLRSPFEWMLASPLLSAQTGKPPDDFNRLPKNLPAPVDDGAARHLEGMAMPAIQLHTTRNRSVNLGALDAPRTVIYCYPRTGAPGQDVPASWNAIPGARGCTPETCGFRDHHKELLSLHAEVFGLSTQTTEYQQEMVTRLHVPFEVLADPEFTLTDSLRLPTFTFEGVRLLKRLTLVVSQGKIGKVFYPVFPPDKHATEVVAWLKQHPA